MNIFENTQYFNPSQNTLMDSSANNATASTFDANLAAVLIPALIQAQNQQQNPQIFENTSDSFTSIHNNLGTPNFGLNTSNLALSANTLQNDNSSINSSLSMQLEYLQQLQLMKQQQQQQDQQREQYKFALLSELLKLEQQSSSQQQIQPLLGLNNLSGQFNQQQQQQQQNMLLELILQQNKLSQPSQQPYLNDYLNQQNQLLPKQATLINTTQSPKYVEGGYDSKTITYIPSIQSCSPQILAQVSPQLKKEDDSSIHLNQQNTQCFKNSAESKRNSLSVPTTSLTQMMEVQDIMNQTNGNQQSNEMNQNEIHSLTKIFTQTNFDNSLFLPTQQQNIQLQQQSQLLEGNSQNIELNLILKSQNNEEQLEIQKKRQERLIKIEKYKNKRRNWLRKISYDCRKKVADSRLRIKGRFISKKDTEKIKELIGDNEEAFNAKKNLRLDFMNNKMKLQNLDLNPAISKNEILCQIEKLLMKNRQIHTNQTMQAIVKRIQKKQGQTEMIRLNAQNAANSGASQHFSESNDESSSVCENQKNPCIQN